MSSNRSILSLPLRKEVITALSGAGYTTLRDLAGVSADSLSKELAISDEVADQILSYLAPAPTAPGLSMTQSVAVLAQPNDKFSTGCSGLDKILGGGLQRGHILELSGPPGSPKELIARNLIIEFAKLGHSVILVDCQNSIDLRALQRSLQGSDSLQSVSYQRVMDLPSLLLFFEHLPGVLAQRTKDTLLVVASLSFPFQSPDLTPARRNILLQKLKQLLAKETNTQRVTVVTTSSLATKMVNADGSIGTFDTGTQGIMVPQLGSLYLPSGKSWRILLAPNEPMNGFVRLYASPQHQQNPGSSYAVEPYTIVSAAA
ncbi:hypothetical protein CC1G_02546 [Coprinopsis cinerea okayama7|uniref:RecA family profile 1 domain-containing protein n=1 Tax=Coprinopsis cinerea (strain Okayama-7 / 130 / ATCC MYA-4618 / FGSC 9003) TaxID=240176 RepID=A8NBT6_COPC7|nr:hypothetical protein CC1G_02546 [Coprinopsis cinerea okayama7\|eukprot:XP_001832284.2 hypothetical protein CC1G_02546 [Coprinopsis cinerea okayama7\